ncbi:MAG: VOC family protein [Candidatus Binatia bacterium]|nr:VOC family protein [Candidatus Binatia bacterium]
MSTVSASDGVASLGLPPVDQVGFVVKSLAEARERYEALFGPFTEIDGSVQEAEYRGRIADVKLAILFGRSGDLEIEFIEWQDGESPHREFIDTGREGMHHLRYRVDDVESWIAKLGTVGYRAIWYKKLSPEIAFSYLEREGDALLIELLQMP